MGSAKSATPIRILFVCTGNICRSPLAEQVFRQVFAEHGLGDKFSFSSAGVYAEVGQPIHELSAQSMSELGFQPEEHVARQLNSPMLEEADLVLSSTTDHRATVARTLVSANRYSFTLPELSRVVAYLASDPEALADIPAAKTPAEKLKLASDFRGYAPPAESLEDIDDPWGRPYEEYLAVANATKQYAQQLASWLGAK